MKNVGAFVKSFLLFLRPGLWAGWLANGLRWWAYLIKSSQWIARHPAKYYSDFYSPKRTYAKRYQLYQILLEKENLAQTPLIYVELGVSKGLSFKWWLEHNQHPESRFYGFDTFEGLPEKWGRFGEGAMAAGIPEIPGNRHQFLKGLFQDTLPGFLNSPHWNKPYLKIIHLDADLYSSTLFGLTRLHPYLSKGDILIFDEFNVPHHEFKAFSDFAESYYVKVEVLASVNNYFQVAMRLI